MINYTRIPNDFIDNLKLNPYQFQILSIIVRKTDGWCKVEDGISLSQFEKLVTFKKPKIIQTLKELEYMDLISKRKQLLDNNANSFNMYRISERVVIENNKGSNQELQGVVTEDYTQNKTNTKETKQNKGYSIEFENAWKWYNENTTRPTGDKKKAYSSYLKQLKIIPTGEIYGAIYNYVMECKKSNTFTKHLVSFLNGDLEKYLNRNRNIKIETKPTYNYTEDGTMICKPEFKYDSGL